MAGVAGAAGARTSPFTAAPSVRNRYRIGAASYDVDAATMHLERHERGIHALWPGAGVAGGADARFCRAQWPATSMVEDH